MSTTLKYLPLRWAKTITSGNTPDGHYYESNSVLLKGPADVQIQLPYRDVEISYLVSLNGERFASVKHDYFAELHIGSIPVSGWGQIVKFQCNKLPEHAIVVGVDLIDAGGPGIQPNGFAGKEGELFRDKHSEIFAGKQS